MHLSFLFAVSAWLGFLCLLTFSLGALAKTFPESPGKRHLPHTTFPRWKRMLDLFCLALMLPALLPLGAVIASVIKLSSRGGVLFSQERIGFLGQPFQCFKFRTMRADVETHLHEAHDDEVVTLHPHQQFRAIGPDDNS